jgi:hypothetical protein
VDASAQVEPSDYFGEVPVVSQADNGRKDQLVKQDRSSRQDEYPPRIKHNR